MKSLLKKGLLTIAFFGALTCAAQAPVAYAQDAVENLATVGDESGLGSGDIKITIANFIRTALTFLGVIALCIVLYGGFVWMTAAGDTEKVDRAKKILINGGIGLVIILMSWSITTFILTSILGATGGTGGSGGSGGGSGGGMGGSGNGGSPSSFEVTGISPEGTQTIRNIQVQITFSRAVLDTSAIDAITVTNALGAKVNGKIIVSGKRVTFVPENTCPAPNEDRFCFEENTTYTVAISEEIESTSGVSLTCTKDTCSGSFTSGTLIDTEDPNASMSAPDDRDVIAADSAERVEVWATDDAGVATADFAVDGGDAFESVLASGDDIADVILEGIWDTAGLTFGKKYKVSVLVTDVAGNTDEDAVTVTARPATCFNGVQDREEGETDVDCGGDASSPLYCGACAGSSCSESATCGGSSSCEDGVCSDLPQIASIAPDNGAPGTYVTISGSGFGNSEGGVYFTTSNGGTVAAALASCADGWSDEEIVVVVPKEAIDGPISVMTSGGDVDETDDEEGELIPDFDVNETQRPGLCSVTPDSGMIADAVVFSGNGFGATRKDSKLIFGSDDEAGSYIKWTDGSITATVPSVNKGKYSVSAFVDGVESNTVTFKVTEEAAKDGPAIVSINPLAGGPGQYVTISGTSFGGTLGSVWFENNETGDRTQGSIDFPDACEGDVWSDKEITIIVPNVIAGSYSLSVESRTGKSSPVAFAVTKDSPTPGLCSISPDTGEANDRITLYGDNFGPASGAVTFATAVSGEITAWSNDEVVVTVPSLSKTGSVTVSNSKQQKSNPITFTVGSDSSATATQKSAAYAWSFSSGIMPDVPEVIVACSDKKISAVPNKRFTKEACVNAEIYAEFTVEMNEGTLDDALRVEKCVAKGDQPCDEVSSVTGTYTTTATSVTFSPDTELDVSTTYQVTISTAAMSADASPLVKDEVWTFTTKGDTTDCEVESVIISPDRATLEAIGTSQEFSALPVADCTVLHADDYVWSWDMSNDSYATLSSSSDAEDCDGGSSPCATATARAEGSTRVSATERTSAQRGDAELTINFSDPYVTRYFPNCTEACTNAVVGANFNVPMDSASITSGASLYLCANELCTALTKVSTAVAGCTLNEEGDCMGFAFALENTLTASAYYRVILSGDIESTSGVPLIRTNYGNDFSWKFRVRKDGSVCAVERVAMSPATAQSSEVGDQKVFTAEAYGESDSCSVSGQLLDGYSYAWTWTNPISDENNDNDTRTVVAEWTDAAFADTDPGSIAEGCTAVCTSVGSAAHAAVCGDGSLETDEGEECEDGNVTNGDGCSSSCLREGNDAVTYRCSGSLAACTSMNDDAACAETCSASLTCSISGATCATTDDCAYAASTCNAVASGCGDEIIDDAEDCDDGNTVDGDGCSSVCLAEGSSAIGATCGNNDVAYNTKTYAGEECDDGNAKNNDGCSSACLNEGTPTLASIGGAICGDGIVDDPYESCDDRNVNDDDGCSSSCLYEGSSLSYALPSLCGDGKYGTGEECEDGNKKNGDGCSARCILEGSSASYAEPSYCGDGIWDEKSEVEACEVGAGGDGRVDPVQSAEIADSAVFEVSSETGSAVATINAAESSSAYTASASWTLFCAATSDTDCSNPVTQGVGIGNCCMDRPTVTLVPNGADTCRNAALYGIFSDEMSIDSFSYKNTDGKTSYRMYAALDLSSTNGKCPDTHTTLVQAPSGFFARVWQTVKSWIFGKEAFANIGDCVLPITGYSQSAQTEGGYHVYLKTSELMVANATYSLIVEGDGDITDGAIDGVRSRYGVGMYGDATNHDYAAVQKFSVGSEICAVDLVEVTDDHAENPGTFSSLDDAHSFSAAALSYKAGMQEIAPIEGVYDWTWSSWGSDDTSVVNATQDGVGLDTATVIPGGENGTANVIATLTIENNTSGIETESEISGYSEATALLCENPWPSIDYYPWTDDATGTAVGSEAGIGWTNFSLGYCKDDGEEGVGDDLPSLTVISPDDTQDDAILKEYLFQVQGSSDAIGIRIAANKNYLSPLAWYYEQGFSGSPSETTVDGFPAVEDGRTLYVAAPNLNEAGSSLYSNMYIISYNGDAGDEAEAIYDQIIANILFATNVSSVGYCSTGSSYTTECSSDLDCTATGESCADIKSKLARDTRRLADMTDLGTALQKYGNDNGYCSETTSQLCSVNNDCPGSETCEAGVPLLSSGTFVRAFASSVWGSWDDILGGALGTNIPADPLNVYNSCGNDPYATYDAETCVDETRGQYVCPENSHAYHYRSYGANEAFIFADLEYAGANWHYDIGSGAAEHGIHITIGGASGNDGFTVMPFCDGTSYGGSSTCGDGIIGSSEVCEIGEVGGELAVCDSDADGNSDGYISQICNSTCTDFIDNASAVCTPASCGNGIVESPEVCDDGAANGRYGYCGSSCDYETAMFCGDGELSGGEYCDCGDSDVFSVFSSVPASARAYGATSGGSCTAFNGVYTASPSAGCAWDCSGAPAYCGDGQVTGSEQCDGVDDTWSGELCFGGSDNGDVCTTDNDCAGGGVCGGSGVYAACATGYTRVLPCDDAIGGSCVYTSNWTSVSCTEIGSCGDGVVDPDEACDDGNSDGTDACTSACTMNVCGDGYLYSGEEECDEGTGNGGGCDAAYGSTCSACTTSCRQTVSSGAFCGDGITNGSEYCDGSDIPYQYYDSATNTVAGSCTPGSPELTDGSNNTYTCRRIGMCDGGPENGEYCTSSTGGTSGVDYAVCDANGSTSVTCEFPSCADACTSSCPMTQVTTSLLMTPNLPGSSDSSSVDLYSYTSGSTSSLPNAAMVTMPACNVAGTLTGTIDMSNVDLPDAYVVFVTDRSGSMANTLGTESRMSVARDLLETSITALFEGLGEDMHISLLGYSYDAGTGICNASHTYSCNSDDDCSGNATCDDELTSTLPYGFGDVADEATLQARVLQFTEDGNTHTAAALTEAKALLDAVPDNGNVRKIVVLLSDGLPTDSPESAADALKNATTANGEHYEVYTVTLASPTETTLIANMNSWSSNDGASINANGIDYAYDGDTAAELQDAYQSIIDSILGITVSVISSDGTTAELTSDIVTEGNNISFPWPENFTCDPTSEQEVPIQLTFMGEGTVNLSALRIEYCAP